MTLPGRLRSLNLSLPVALWGVGIIAAVAVVIIIFRLMGLLQGLELYGYDVFMRNLRPTDEGPTRVAVVAIDEDDLSENRFGFPVPDDALAKLLQRILRDGPAAIGVDLYRDRAIAPGSGELERVLMANPSIIGVKSLGDEQGVRAGIQPHPVLRHDPTRVGFADAPEDPDGATRRALVTATEAGEDVLSLALTLVFAARREEPGKEYTALGALRFGELPANAGAYSLPKAEARGAQIVIDFARAQQIRDDDNFIAAWEVLEGKTLPGAFRDKIVLIGQTAKSIKDFARTPIASKMPGVEIHANIVDQLLRMIDGEPALQTWSEKVESAYIVLWSAIGGLVALPALRWRPGTTLRQHRRTARGMWLFVLSILLGVIVIIAIAAVAFTRKTFIPVAPPIIAMIGAAAGMALFVYFRERDARQIDRELTEMHIPPAIVQTILAQPAAFLKNGRLPGKKMTGTVLFTDLQGFATAAEAMEPGKLLIWLNQYFDEMCQAIENPPSNRRGGIISKFNGDQIMAFWGPPFDRPDERDIAEDARGAVDAALEMRSRLASTNARWRDNKLPTTRMRVGIFTGELVAGSLGGAGRLEYSVIGDTVNVASRLENCMKELMDPDVARDGCRILIGDATRERVGDRYDLRDLGEHLLSGMRAKVRIFAVLGRREAGSSILKPREAAAMKGRV